MKKIYIDYVIVCGVNLQITNLFHNKRDNDFVNMLVLLPQFLRLGAIEVHEANILKQPFIYSTLMLLWNRFISAECACVLY